MCIYYQDELALCCLKTENMWVREVVVRCMEERYDTDTPPTCPDKITMKQAIDSVKKLKKIEEFLRNAPVAPVAVPNIIMKIIVEEEQS